MPLDEEAFRRWSNAIWNVLCWLCCWLHFGGKERDNIIANDAKSSLAFFFYTLRPIQRYSIIVAHWYLDVWVIQTAAACVYIVFLFKWRIDLPIPPAPSDNDDGKSNQWKCVGIFLPGCLYILYANSPPPSSSLPFFSWPKNTSTMFNELHSLGPFCAKNLSWLVWLWRPLSSSTSDVNRQQFPRFPPFSLYSSSALFFFTEFGPFFFYILLPRNHRTRHPKGHTTLREKSTGSIYGNGADTGRKNQGIAK